ncbi:hypothetical protein AOC05_03585 [Arthrobacter alpinus]|uniref:Uncharacterized protein n=1 Tax=Arthrobacter alpinus TaxID=656366 RepID=A0A0M5M3G3_9MICC|nr:hypothetical protein [Arthrobacter alpinus]ALE91632.1 hypothetical protein AOC05_03585 [Arthrobacter alpinus]
MSMPALPVFPGPRYTVDDLALSSTLTPLLVGRLRDQKLITAGSGMSVGLAPVAAGTVLLASAPQPTTLYMATVVIGTVIGITTSLGFAHLAASAERRGMETAIAHSKALA